MDWLSWRVVAAGAGAALVGWLGFVGVQCGLRDQCGGTGIEEAETDVIIGAPDRGARG